MSEIHPLKKSPSQTKLGNFIPDSPTQRDEAGGESSLTKTTPKLEMRQNDGMEGHENLGKIDGSFETLFLEGSTLTRPMSAFETIAGNPPYPKGKLFSPITEMLQANQTLKRMMEEQLPSLGVKDKGEVGTSHEEVEKVLDYEEGDMTIQGAYLTAEEARVMAEEIISDLEEDVEQVFKFRGGMSSLTTPAPEPVDDRYYI